MIELANLQDMKYFEKYHDILCHNLRMTMMRVKKERDRPGFEITVKVLELTEMTRGIKECWFLEQIIKTKKELENKHD